MATGTIKTQDIIYIPVSTTISDVPAGTGTGWNFSTTGVPAAYHVQGIIVWETDGNNLFPVWGEMSNGNPVARVWNARTSAATIHVEGLLICKKS